MLITSKKVSIHDVVVIKLANGEEVIGRLASGAIDQKVTLSKPLVAHPVQSRDGSGIALAFAPFCPAANDGDFTFLVANLLIEPVLARDEVKNSYAEMTSTIDLTPPPPGLLKV